MRKEKGITLVALVVTIIVLMILAGISIYVTIGDNGVITKAKQAKENIILAQEEENKSLNLLYEQLTNIGGDIDEGDSEVINRLLDFKRAIATAITKEGVTTSENDSKEKMAENIGKIVAERTKNATATKEDIIEGKTAWVKGQLITGTRSLKNENELVYAVFSSENKAYTNGDYFDLINSSEEITGNSINLTEGNYRLYFSGNLGAGGHSFSVELYINGEKSTVLAQYTTANNGGYCFKQSETQIDAKEGDRISIYAKTPTLPAEYLHYAILIKN